MEEVSVAFHRPIAEGVPGPVMRFHVGSHSSSSMLGLDCIMQKTLMTREQQLYQEATIGVPKKKAMTARTKSNLSFVKQNRPELFKAQGGQVQEDAPLPSGFKPLQDGWLHNPDTGVFLEPSGQKLWFDPEAREYQELYEGSTLPLCVHGGATSSSSRAKHVFIPDLHRTAQVLKADLGHLDRPAALLALLDPSAVAQAPHERLIRRLAAARSEWSEEAMSSALAAVLASCEVTGIALALVVGQRAFAAAKGASCWSFAELNVKWPGESFILQGAQRPLALRPLCPQW
eukprot:s1054_g10.t1